MSPGSTTEQLRQADTSRASGAEQATPHVAMERITKRFGRLHANTDIDFELRPGEVHALLGENGAGKSTLMSILFGLLRPDEGRIRVDGREVRFGSPADALRAGIGMVHQHFMLVPQLTVAENVAIGTANRRPFRPRRVETSVAEVAARFGLDVDPRAIVGDLPVEERQRVEIVRLLYRGVRTLILDEPTAALGSAQVSALLTILERLRAAGHSIVIVTHKLEEVMRIADRATVLRGGRAVATLERSAFDRRSLTAAMFAEVPEPRAPRRPACRAGGPLLDVSGMVVRSADRRELVRALDLRVRAGEILGIAGVAGNGQAELIDAIAGVRPIETGTITVDGANITRLSPLARRRLGIGVIPEDRHLAGLVLDMTVAENLALAMVAAGEVSRRGMLLRGRVNRHARELLDTFDVRPADPDRPVTQLSGGNQQKLVVARELAGQPRLLLASSPTRGVDLGAAATIHHGITEAARRGCAVLVTSPDLDELLALADRIAVVFRGSVVYEAGRSDASIDAIGRAMVGQIEDVVTASTGTGS